MSLYYNNRVKHVNDHSLQGKTCQWTIIIGKNMSMDYYYNRVKHVNGLLL